MSKKNFLLVSVLFFCGAANAQYYYKDIISNGQLAAEMKTLRDNKIRSVDLKSFNDDGSESEGFFCEKKISRDYSRSEMFTRADIAAASMLITEFDASGKITHSNDSSNISVTDIRYTYDSKGRIINILSAVHSIDDDFSNRITEEHIYTYADNDQPLKMELVKNKKDTTMILFASDEQGNLSIEKNTKNGAKYYYYYDAKNRLTDIVPATNDGQRLKPDYIFDYTSAGLIAQMTAVQEGTANYFIWKYNYDNGMRIKARCLSDEKRLMGSIEYEYK